MLDIHHIASGSTGNAIVVSDGSTRILFDAGVSVRSFAGKHKVKVSHLSGAFITHEHGDHSKYINELLLRGVTVYASAGTIRALDNHQIVPVSHHNRYQVGTFTIIPFNVEHDAAEPLGFMFESSETGARGMYLTDSSSITGFAKGITHYIVECNYMVDALTQSSLHPAVKKRIAQSHMGYEQLEEFFANADLSKAQKIILIHLSKNHGDAQAFIRGLQAATGLPVEVPD